MKTYPLAAMPGTEMRLLRASNIDQEFQITVALPYDYHKNLDQTYPVIYVLDGNWYFGMVVDMIRIMNTRLPFCNEMPDVIVVGIGYPNGDSLEDLRTRINHRRFRDLRPTRNVDMEAWMHQVFPTDEIIVSGQAAEFHDFIKDELIPVVESSYRADKSDRALIGHSLGGICALDMLFKHPSLFQRYVVVSPASNPQADQLFLESTARLPVRIYLAAGELELAGDQEFSDSYNLIATVLDRLVVDKNALTKHVFADMKHCAVVTPGFHAGMLAVMGVPNASDKSIAKIGPE